MSSWPAIAAANNAEWCDLVCRAHGIDGDLDGTAWTSPARTPPLYPDAVTLASHVPLPELLARIDSSPGCSIKDSFASLDLTEHGFRVLFDAQWIARDPTLPEIAPAGPPWTVVRDVEAFAAWEQAWRRRGGEADVFRAEVLGNPVVTMLAAYVDERIVGGAVLNRSTAAVGISNVFAEAGVARTSWRGCLAAASTLFPDKTLVGYVIADALGAATRHGFEPVGPLRVWLRPS